MLLSLELNEVNFETLQDYITDGKLENFSKLFEKYGFISTTSETQYEHLEPWIQWVTAHTGLTYDEHKVFRLGDIVKFDHKQIWETLEERGVSVGAVSPMNANNATKNPKYFIPDPWTNTEVTGGWFIKKFYQALSQTVNDNASAKITPQSFLFLVLGLLRYGRLTNYFQYVQLALKSKKKKWNKALFLDLLLADVFIKLQKRKMPQFATLFLNAAAHIQHHYMYSSRFYKGERSNPKWYVSADHDPIFEVYNLYDKIIGQLINKFPEARIQLLTGLHQIPYPKSTYYWRIKEHSSFLEKLGVSFVDVQPRMSRDFLVVCESAEAAQNAGRILQDIKMENGDKLFSVDIRGHDLFVELVYEHEITAASKYVTQEGPHSNLFESVSLVAIKNGEHDGTGYYLDTQMPAKASEAGSIPLKNLYAINLDAFPA